MAYDIFFRLGRRTLDWFARAVQLQLFLTLFSLPILLSWGIPFSCISPLGNILFTPFLLLFLLLASCIFFSQLLHIPHALWIFLLNHLTDYWIHLMAYGHTDWLIGSTDIPLLFLVFVALMPFFILAHPVTKQVYRSIACFSIILLCVIGYARYTHQQHSIFSVPCANSELTIFKTASKIILVDPGCLASRSSAPSWTRYTLVPYLLSKGVYRIDQVILLRPKKYAFQAVEQLCSLLAIKQVHMPAHIQNSELSSSKQFKQFIQTFIATGGKLSFFSSTETTVMSNASDHRITLTPTRICSAFVCHGQIDNKKVTLYSSS